MKKLLIVTDLDASLIDETYQFTDALKALEQLRSHQFPLVLNSSKTLAELESIAQELQLSTPLIAENGGIVAVPNDSELLTSTQQYTWEKRGNYSTMITGLSLEFILEQAHEARETERYSFQGFSDWSDQEIADRTGLTLQEASLAKQRHVSEPIIWQDSQKRWERFSSLLNSKGIRTLRGGRFIHLMGDTDKADGLNVTRQLHVDHYPDTQWTTVAVGDSANDQSMLEAADIAIVIPHSKGFQIQVNGSHVIHATSPSSKGWNQAILELLSTF